MPDNKLFETSENKALLAICTRKLISNIGIGGILWGLFNIVVGYVAMQEVTLNAGILILGVMMLGTGIQAVRRPSLGVLLAETIVTILLFTWNLAISLLNLQDTGDFEPGGLIFPLIIAVAFGNHYRKLGHLRDQVAAVEPEKIKETKKLCKALLKKKLKVEPLLVETRERKCRAQLMADRAFFIQRDMMRAFLATREDVRGAIVKPGAKALELHFHHPVGVLKYRFDKKNSEKLNNWILAEAGAAAAQAPATAPAASGPERKE